MFSETRKYVDWSGKPSSPTWRTFLKNHAADTAAIDFFTVPTATFRVLFCFIVLEHSRRRLIHFNVTSNPTAEWTGIQIVQAFPYDTAPKYLLRDNDAIYGQEFRTKVAALGMEEVKITPRSPWQNPFAERVIGSIRQECLDHMIILGEGHLRRVMKKYVDYYHESRPHQSLDRNAPVPREIDPPRRARSSRFPTSAACITDTLVRRETDSRHHAGLPPGGMCRANANGQSGSVT